METIKSNSRSTAKLRKKEVKYVSLLLAVGSQQTGVTDSPSHHPFSESITHTDPE